MEERDSNRNDDADSPGQQSSGDSESLADEGVDNENDLTFENDDGDRVDVRKKHLYFFGMPLTSFCFCRIIH